MFGHKYRSGSGLHSSLMGLQKVEGIYKPKEPTMARDMAKSKIPTMSTGMIVQQDKITNPFNVFDKSRKPSKKEEGVYERFKIGEKDFYKLTHPKSLKAAGKVGEKLGMGLEVVGGATGQPELIGLGAGLQTGGILLGELGDKSQKVRDIAGGSGSPTEIVKELQGIESLLMGGDNVLFSDSLIGGLQKVENTLGKVGIDIGKVIQEGVEREDTLQEEITKELDIIKMEEELLKEDEDIIKESVEVIDQLSDRLQEQLSPIKTFKDVSKLMKDLDKDQVMDFINRNWPIIRDFTKQEIFEVFKQGGL